MSNRTDLIFTFIVCGVHNVEAFPIKEKLQVVKSIRWLTPPKKILLLYFSILKFT